jgi:hypothetical protein
MRKLRVLEADAWYAVRTTIHDHEPVFEEPKMVELFKKVLGEVERIFVFELRDLDFAAYRISFKIKPVDGYQLPAIMRRIQQMFAARFNIMKGRSGHVWGKYWSEVLPGEPSAPKAEE